MVQTIARLGPVSLPSRQPRATPRSSSRSESSATRCGTSNDDPRCYGENVPIYEYRCPNGHVFELFQRIGDAPPPKCEVCDEGPVERVLYPVAIHFKGSGFYSTDYGRGSRKKDASKDGDGGDSKPDKPDKKDSKPEKTAAD
jgi:putative FmdB family regulatory protein